MPCEVVAAVRMCNNVGRVGVVYRGQVVLLGPGCRQRKRIDSDSYVVLPSEGSFRLYIVRTLIL